MRGQMLSFFLTTCWMSQQLEDEDEESVSGLYLCITLLLIYLLGTIRYFSV